MINTKQKHDQDSRLFYYDQTTLSNSMQWLHEPSVLYPSILPSVACSSKLKNFQILSLLNPSNRLGQKDLFSFRPNLLVRRFLRKPVFIHSCGWLNDCSSRFILKKLYQESLYKDLVKIGSIAFTNCKDFNPLEVFLFGAIALMITMHQEVSCFIRRERESGKQLDLWIGMWSNQNGHELFNEPHLHNIPILSILMPHREALVNKA